MVFFPQTRFKKISLTFFSGIENADAMAQMIAREMIDIL
jgi:hypothetical protein